MICDGASLLRADYVDLFGIIGTTYGSADGTHFNLPDLRGRVPVGKGTHADVDALGDSDGMATVADRRPKHKHTVNDAGHAHTTQFGGGASLGGPYPNIGGLNPSGDTSPSNRSTTTVGTGVTIGPQTNVPTDGAAYLTLNFIIKI